MPLLYIRSIDRFSSSPNPSNEGRYSQSDDFESENEPCVAVRKNRIKTAKWLRSAQATYYLERRFFL